MQVPKQLRESFLEAVKAGRIRSMQNKLMPAAPIHTPGALLLGDAFNMRHPLTGQQVCIAWSPIKVQGAAVLQPPLELLEGVPSGARCSGRTAVWHAAKAASHFQQRRDGAACTSHLSSGADMS